jgi:predicted PurR-regulated permease PerM
MSESDIRGVGDKIREAVGSIGQAVLQGSVNTLGGVGNMLFQITLLLIFSISFLLDGDKLGSSALAAMPARWRDGASLVVKSVQTSFGSFVRGQLLSALVYAAMNAAIMLAFGLPNVLVGALAAGLLVIVPLVGNYLSFIPPLVICLVVRPDATLLLLVVLVVVQAIYMNVISPRIMSKAVNMHPLFTMGSILVFGQLWGFWGGLFGIPIASTIGMLARPTLHLVQNYLNPAPEPQSQTQPTPADPPLQVEAANVEVEEVPLDTSLATSNMEGITQ